MFGVGSRRQRTVRGLGTSKTEATVAESAAIPAELNSHGGGSFEMPGIDSNSKASGERQGH